MISFLFVWSKTPHNSSMLLSVCEPHNKAGNTVRSMFQNTVLIYRGSHQREWETFPRGPRLRVLHQTWITSRWHCCLWWGHRWHNAKLNNGGYYQPICDVCSYVSDGLNMIKQNSALHTASMHCMWPLKCGSYNAREFSTNYDGVQSMSFSPSLTIPFNRGQSHILTHPLSFRADCVANDICPIRCACWREEGGLPADLKHPWSLPTEHLYILGRLRRAWEVRQQV